MDKEFETKEDMNIKENEEIINDKETTDESLDNTNETKKDYIKKEDTTSTDKDDNEDEYEKICYVCRRPESRAGKMVSMPGNIYVCTDCLQRSFDTMNDGLAGFPGFGGLNGMNVNISEEDLEKLLKMPNVRMVTSDDFNREIPKNQKLKKKKKTEEKEVKFGVIESGDEARFILSDGEDADTQTLKRDEDSDETKRAIGDVDSSIFLLPYPESETVQNPLLKADPMPYAFKEDRITDLFN